MSRLDNTMCIGKETPKNIRVFRWELEKKNYWSRINC